MWIYSAGIANSFDIALHSKNSPHSWLIMSPILWILWYFNNFSTLLYDGYYNLYRCKLNLSVFILLILFFQFLIFSYLATDPSMDFTNRNWCDSYRDQESYIGNTSTIFFCISLNTNDYPPILYHSLHFNWWLPPNEGLLYYYFSWFPYNHWDTQRKIFKWLHWS